MVSADEKKNSTSERRVKGRRIRIHIVFETFCANSMGAENLPEKQIRGEILSCLLSLSSRAEPVATACPKQCGNQRGCECQWMASGENPRRRNPIIKCQRDSLTNMKGNIRGRRKNSWCLTLTANCNIIAQEGLAGVVTGVCSG